MGRLLDTPGSEPDDGGLRPAIRFHLLGKLDWAAAESLQKRLAYEAGAGTDSGIVVLLCEHQPLITVGRSGSRGHIRLSNSELLAHRLSIRWVGRGGGCILHGPGQLAVYPIVPLDLHRWTVGAFMRRFHEAVADTLDELRIHTETVSGSWGIWGRSGALAVFGTTVSRDVAYHGAFINVNPPMTCYRFVDVMEAAPEVKRQKTTMGSLLAERRQAITMPKVRALLIPHLAAAFGTRQYHLFTGHPYLASARAAAYERRSTYRAS